MDNLLTPLDYVIFCASVLVVMAIGMWAGRREESTADYYLAGRGTRWWGVAGSIFGSNVSANHMVGMMGLGFTVGFAQSQFELTAIAGLLMLCYAFLPVYRKLKVYTLSEYLSRRFDDRSRVLYALIMLIIMVVVQMVPGFYFGSRSINILLQGGTGDVPSNAYIIGILVMMAVTGTYTIFGGLKAVIMTDVIQTFYLLAGGLIVAFIVFSQPEIGGWGGMRALDAAAAGADKMHLYEPINHPDLPWTGMFTGLMLLHFYYWGTNQFIVQRALAARSGREAKLGIIAAGFLKLLIPFFSIGTGIAAYYLFKARHLEVASDAVFSTLLNTVVAPVGPGLVGLIAAGLIGAILSSIDSMLNSSATIFVFDFYRRYLRPEANEKELILVGRVWTLACLIVAAGVTILFMDPNSQSPFFLFVANQQSNLITGVVIAFVLGILWKRATAAGAFVAILTGIVLSYGLPPLYKVTLGTLPSVAAVLGERLNFMHAALVAALGALVAMVIVSLKTVPDVEKSKLTWSELGRQDARRVRTARNYLLGAVAIYAALGLLMVFGGAPPIAAGTIAGLATWGLFIRSIFTLPAREAPGGSRGLLSDDRFWGGLLGGVAVYMMYYYY